MQNGHSFCAFLFREEAILSMDALQSIMSSSTCSTEREFFTRPRAEQFIELS